MATYAFWKPLHDVETIAITMSVIRIRTCGEERQVSNLRVDATYMNNGSEPFEAFHLPKNAYYVHSDEDLLRQTICKGTHEIGFINPGGVGDILLKIVLDKSNKTFKNSFMRYPGGLNF